MNRESVQTLPENNEGLMTVVLQLCQNTSTFTGTVPADETGLQGSNSVSSNTTLHI